ncbi:glycoside hydrolase family 79 protein [Athelia psychrophila]|uniref:Glycoside hydrolase family 79 protein n=1 Tax=Athelia psychrophila TaxID=1759441 RepID=A0A166QM24_9AGAM|nr:glycoside hydrolase family 79 protein [Fibularhizoctonia sp. CBS 109695]
MLHLMAPIAFSFAFFSSAVNALDVSVPLSSSGAVTVSPSLCSFSIEQDRWPDWAGTTTKNTFFYNALENLKQITGEPPWIRIGADSEDHTNFNPATEYADDIFPNYTATVPYPEASNITVGSKFYQLVSRLPANTHVWWGVNLRADNITAAYLETKAIVQAFASSAVKSAGITLDFLEIGNEADLYVNNKGRVAPYGPTQYVPEQVISHSYAARCSNPLPSWVNIATNVSSAAGLSSTSSTKLIGAAFASSSHTTTGMSPQGIFAAGILKTKPGALITTISQHHYSGSFCSGNGDLLQNLMTKSTIRSNLTSFLPDITASQAQGLDYVLGETNSYSCHGAPGVSNTAGAALWALDYLLYAPQIGISRVFFHEGIGYKYNLIQPVALNRSILDGSALAKPLAPHFQPAYYAAIIAAEAIGKTGSTKAVELTIGSPTIAGYAFYESGTLARVLLINSKAYLSTTTTSRGSVHVSLDFTGSGTTPRVMEMKKLIIGHADDTAGLTWGGQTYETSTGLVSGSESALVTLVASGVNISDTEAILLQFLPPTAGLQERGCRLKSAEL